MTLKPLYLILLIILCNSCCDENKGCCGSEPPEPGLTSEAKLWLSPYIGNKNFVFENQLNQRDTLSITFERDKEFCGGEECGGQCEYERAILRSKADPSIEFKIEAVLNNHIIINYNREDPLNANKNMFSVHLLLGLNNVSADPGFVDAKLFSDYLFKGEKLTVIKAQCNDAIKCNGFKMPSGIVAKEKGLIEFEDYKGNRWTKIK